MPPSIRRIPDTNALHVSCGLKPVPIYRLGGDGHRADLWSTKTTAPDCCVPMQTLCNHYITDPSLERGLSGTKLKTVLNKYQQHYRDCMMRMRGNSCYRGSLGMDTGVDATYDHGHTYKPKTLTIRSVPSAKCEAKFFLEIFECNGCNCTSKKDNTDLLRVVATHRLQNNTEAARHDSCALWFGNVDLAVRAVVAKLRTQLSAAKLRSCSENEMRTTEDFYKEIVTEESEAVEQEQKRRMQQHQQAADSKKRADELTKKKRERDEKELEDKGLKAVYLGCWNDCKNGMGAHQRDMPTSKGVASLDKCRTLCKGYKYLGRQFTHACSCGNKYGSQGSAPKKPGCQLNAPAIPPGIGGCINAVYEVNLPKENAPKEKAEKQKAGADQWYLSKEKQVKNTA